MGRRRHQPSVESILALIAKKQRQSRLPAFVTRPYSDEELAELQELLCNAQRKETN